MNQPAESGVARKVCVITGASSGIGAACARLFAMRGWNVAINYSRSPAPAETVGRECRAMGVEAIVIQADVSSDAQCRAMSKLVDNTWGRADVLVNNAGTTKFVPVADLEGLNADDFQHIHAVNVVGTFQMARAFAPIMKRNAGGAIVNMSSIAGTQGLGSSLAYMASKGAINAMTVGLARALAPHIRVNAVAPGLVETPWLKEGYGASYEARVRDYKDKAPLATVASAEDIAETVWWLGVAARVTTGEVIAADAGIRLRKA